jgi:hypothetical protein
MSNYGSELKYPCGYINPITGYVSVAACFCKDGEWQEGYLIGHRENAALAYRLNLTSNDVVHHRDSNRQNNFYLNLSVIDRKIHTEHSISRMNKAKRNKRREKGLLT